MKSTERVAAFLCGILILGAASCTTSADEPSQLTNNRFTPCGHGFDCARVKVPIDGARSARGSVTLPIIRHSAPGSHPGTLFVAPGRVEGEGTAWLRRHLASLGSLAKRFDIVALDARQTQVECGSDATRVLLDSPLAPRTKRQIATLARNGGGFIDSCRRRTGRLFDALGPSDGANDVESVASYLGAGRVSFLGLSDGASTGLVLVDSDRSIRAAVLDGADAGLGSWRAFVTERAFGLERALDRFLATCNDDCPLAGGEDNPRSVAGLLRELQRHPLEVDGARLTAAKAYLSIEEYLSDPRGWPLLDDAIHNAIQGRGTALMEGFTAYAGDRPPGSVIGGQLGMACSSAAWPSEARPYRDVASHLERRAPVFGAESVWRFFPCAGHSGPSLPAPHSAGNVLMVAATQDPSVSYSSIRSYAEQAGWPLLTRLGVGHTSFFQSACVRDESTAFLRDLVEPKPDTKCPSDYGPGSTG